MASKSKQGDLVTCDVCRCSVSVKERGTHQNSCAETSALSADLSKLDHSVIQDNHLFAKCQVLSLKEIQEHVHFNITKKIILLHPSTMKCCQMYFGRPVVLNRSAVFIAWASTAIPVNAVGMDRDAFRSITPLAKSDLILVESYSSRSVEAKTVECTINAHDSTLKKNDQFVNYVTKMYVNRYLTGGSVIHIDFYGKECQLTVSKITGVDDSDISMDLYGDCDGKVAMVTEMDESYVLDVEKTDLDTISEDLESQCTIKSNIPDLTSSTPLKTKPCSDGYFTDLPPKRAFYLISHNTKLTFTKDENDEEELVNTGPTLADFGGYADQINKLKEMIHNRLFRSNVIRNKGLYCPQSILLYGPSGSGKTMLATVVGKLFPVHYITITGADVWSKFYGETETKLRAMFDEAKERAPSIIFLDDVNALCSRRGSSRSETEKRIVSTVLTLLDGVASSSKSVFVIAATNKRSELDKSIRRPGRLETELEIGVPSIEDRIKILGCLLRHTDHTVTGPELETLGENAHGFLGADLSSVCKEAMMRTMRRGAQLSPDSDPPQLSLEDLTHGFQVVKPSAMKEVTLEIAKVSWSDIGGQEDLKHKLRQSVEWPLKHPEAFTRLGIPPPRGLLMYGPPGCSKTMIAKALAKESGLNFIAIKGPELFSKWVGESESAVRDLFARARTAAPAIIFFDEIDALASNRGNDVGGGTDVSGRVLAQLLTEMDGVESLEDIMVVAATNRPDKIDKALMRPGRLDRIVYVPLPDTDTRRSIFQIKFRSTPTAPDVNVEELVTQTERYSGAEVTAVCHEAALAAMQENLNADQVHRRHFLQALKTVTPRITQELLDIYRKYREEGS